MTKTIKISNYLNILYNFINSTVNNQQPKNVHSSNSNNIIVSANIDIQIPFGFNRSKCRYRRKSFLFELSDLKTI